MGSTGKTDDPLRESMFDRGGDLPLTALAPRDQVVVSVATVEFSESL